MVFENRIGQVMPTIEQVTTITSNKLAKEWHFYTNDPIHAQRWESFVVPSDNCESFKVYHEQTGELIEVAGKLLGDLSVIRYLSKGYA